MPTHKKLALYTDERVIRRAKAHADAQGMSVSDMVESYLADVSPELDVPVSLAPMSDTIRAFAGIVSLPDPDDAEEQARKLRVERHGGTCTVHDEHKG